MYRGGALGRVESDLWKEACSDRGRPCTCHHIVLLASAFKIAVPYIEPDAVAGYEIGYCLFITFHPPFCKEMKKKTYLCALR